jgi:arylsulfatase
MSRLALCLSQLGVGWRYSLRRPWSGALAGLVLAGACGGKPAPPAVLLVSIDTLRPDHLGIYGYERDTSPNIDRFFAEAAVYRRAYATGSRTPPSVASMLTGRDPAGHRVRLFYQKLPRRIAAIPDLLPPGFQTAGFVGNAVVADDAMGLADRFDYFEDEVDRPALYTNNVERSADGLTDAALRWLREERDPARPFFLWVHYMDPHSPYLPPESWRLRGYEHAEPHLVDPERLAKNNIQREEAEAGEQVDALISRDAYDEEIAFTDHHIGRLLAAFDAASSRESSLALLTADHGESMLEHQIYFVHGYQVYDEMVRIPLLVRAAGVEAGPRKRLVSLIDVLPTVLGHAQVVTPPELPGRDLRPRGGDSERRVFAETTYLDAQWRAAWQGDDKWVLEVAIHDGRLEQGYHYDLAHDPGELAPSKWSPGTPPSQAAHELSERARRDPDPAGIPNEKRANPHWGAPNAVGNLLREQLEKLRALGYVD